MRTNQALQALTDEMRSFRGEVKEILAQQSERIEEHDKALERINASLHKVHDRMSDTRRTVGLQKEKIDRLEQRLDKLVEDGTATAWNDDSRTALDIGAVKRTASNVGCTYSKALDALDERGRLHRGCGGKRSCPVRDRRTGKVKRAIVIIRKD